ncbi:MAG TPA: phosphoglucosamine mutase [Thermoanaerobaculia bacterium]|nr:phosphoglucosamine mutase [Thermoanaerobaculia bacterium]
MKLFGTDGLRGKAGEFPLDPASARLVGEQVGRRSGGRVVLGGDTRESTPGLIRDLAAGLRSSGCDVALAGVVPTPAVAELVLALSAGAGISVSASHNPYQDNGIKVFGSDGRKWPDSEEEAVEKRLLDARGSPHPGPLPPGEEEVAAQDELAEIYLRRLAEHVPVRLNGLAVVVDAGNGAAYRVGPEALRRAGGRVAAICDRPDGRNINDGCGALHPQVMAAKTEEAGAAMGVAFDGDADRAIFAAGDGRILDGDDVLWILARDWNHKGILRGRPVVGTVMSNYGLEHALAREGIAFHRAPVGDRNVARRMEETGAPIGGEASGHVILPFSPAGDGIQTALLVAAVLAESARPLTALATLEKTPQQLRNVRAARRIELDRLPELTRAVARAREALDHHGRVFLRYSGTEPLLRILVEGTERGAVLAIADELERVARAELGAAG